MVGHHYHFCLVKRGFSPTNFAMFNTTHATNNSGLLCLQNKIANRLGI